jgi:hypothetical protein
MEALNYIPTYIFPSSLEKSMRMQVQLRGGRSCEVAVPYMDMLHARTALRLCLLSGHTVFIISCYIIMFGDRRTVWLGD